MAKFNFRLQTYLNLKAKIEDQKRNEFGKAVAALELEKTKLVNLQQERNDCIDEFRKKVESTIEPGGINRYNLYLDVLKKRIAEQKSRVARAEAFLRAKRAELVEAMKNRKILETLKEKDFETYLIEEKKNEQKIVDDLISYKYSK